MDHEWEKDEQGKYICQYNIGCHCNVPNCGSCGWNPEVARRRLLEYIRQKGEKNDAQ